MAWVCTSRWGTAVNSGPPAIGSVVLTGFRSSRLDVGSLWVERLLEKTLRIQISQNRLLHVDPWFEELPLLTRCAFDEASIGVGEVYIAPPKKSVDKWFPGWCKYVEIMCSPIFFKVSIVRFLFCGSILVTGMLKIVVTCGNTGGLSRLHGRRGAPGMLRILRCLDGRLGYKNRSHSLWLWLT